MNLFPYTLTSFTYMELRFFECFSALNPLFTVIKLSTKVSSRATTCLIKLLAPRQGGNRGAPGRLCPYKKSPKAHVVLPRRDARHSVKSSPGLFKRKAPHSCSALVIFHLDMLIASSNLIMSSAISLAGMCTIFQSTPNDNCIVASLSSLRLLR